MRCKNHLLDLVSALQWVFYSLKSNFHALSENCFPNQGHKSTIDGSTESFIKVLTRLSDMSKRKPFAGSMLRDGFNVYEFYDDPLRANERSNQLSYGALGAKVLAGYRWH